MQRLSLVSLLAFIGLAVFAACRSTDTSESKAIYGLDDRTDIKDKEPEIRKIARSVMGISRRSDLERLPDGWRISRTFSEFVESVYGKPLCKDERFRSEPAAVDCTGFLVGSDLVMTAGHCVESLSDCQEAILLLDYVDTAHPAVFKDSQAFACKEIVTRGSDGHDYMILRLDRDTGRSPFNVRDDDQPITDKVFAIGHPFGLPLKYVGPEPVIASTPTDFRVLLDLYQGNSGSPVISVRDGVVEGLVQGGIRDFFEDYTGCMRSLECPEDSFCPGETVLPAQVFSNDVKRAITVDPH